MHTLMSPFFIRTLSSLHTGSGDDNGLVDLPIQRELVTGYPKIEASTLKGAIRSRVEQLGANATKIHLAFGYDEDSIYNEEEDGKKKDIFSGQGSRNEYAQQFMGALAFTDARILFFPIRSMKGVFALVTCPYVLSRLVDDLVLSGNEEAIKAAVDNLSMEDLVDSDNHFGYCLSTAGKLKTGNGHIILEEYTFEVKPDRDVKIANLVTQLNALTGLNLENLVIVDDDVFSDFTQLFTERMTRNKIDDKTGTVEDGGLFTEEYLPPESVLYSLLLADKPRQPGNGKQLPKGFNKADEVIKLIKEDCWNENAKKVLQIGGNATVGKGIVELYFIKES